MTDNLVNSKSYLPISDLSFGFNDAVQYKHKSYKNMFSRIFVRTSTLDELMKPTSYFLIGEKGYGKTAISIYVSNNSHNTFANNIYLGATDYTDFINLKQKGLWILSDYKVAWKVTLLYLISQLINSRESGIFKLFSAQGLGELRKLLADYEQYSRSPEISQAIKLIQSFGYNLEATASATGMSGKTASNRNSLLETNQAVIQDKLRDLQKRFEDAIRSIRVKNNYVIFIDGIDVRPVDIEHSEYTECIRGLGAAAWELNSEFFSNLKGTQGNLKIVLLTRVDILRQMQLHNISSKIDDNSVIINWYAPMNQISSSPIYKFAQRLLTWNQPDLSATEAEVWRHYFRTENLISTFGKILRFTLYRPRDIVKVFGLIKKYSISKGENFLNIDHLENSALQREYSEYMLSEIRDQISFYFNEDDYKVLLKFFDFFNGKVKLRHSDFTVAYEKLVANLKREGKRIPGFANSEEEFLQYLYDLSIICYIEYSNTGARFVRWSHIERSPADLNPQVKLRTDYEIHKGLVKSLNLGLSLKETEETRTLQANTNLDVRHETKVTTHDETRVPLGIGEAGVSRKRRRRRRRSKST